MPKPTSGGRVVGTTSGVATAEVVGPGLTVGLDTGSW